VTRDEVPAAVLDLERGTFLGLSPTAGQAGGHPGKDHPRALEKFLTPSAALVISFSFAIRGKQKVKDIVRGDAEGRGSP